LDINLITNLYSAVRRQQVSIFGCTSDSKNQKV